MAAVYLAGIKAFSREKPHSSVTDLIEILTSPNYEDEAYDGIPELIEVINLQPTGPTEASRAIRKKLKHGDSHRQYRALVLLKAAVENGEHRFKTTFADDQLVDAIKHLATESTTAPKVKKKLISILASWHREYQGEPRMSTVASLYNSVPHGPSRQAAPPRPVQTAEQENEWDKKRREEREAKEEAKRKAKQAKLDEKAKREEELRKRENRGKKRPPFDFEKEKPQILNSIAETSQAANNLINALTLVNTEHDSIQENARVQECLERAKQERKRVVRYIQLVENEEVIGTLLDTNERVIAALQMYDMLLKPIAEEEVQKVQDQMASLKIQHTGEVDRLQEKQRAAVERSKNRNRDRDRDRDTYSPPASAGLHPDLQDLDFGGEQQRNLPPPLRPSAPESEEDERYARGSLSDYSSYSSDEETHNKRETTSALKYGGESARRNYVNVSTEEFESNSTRKGLLQDDDPFADPFADSSEVSGPSKGKQTAVW